MILLEDVKKDVSTFFKANKEFFFNERDFQMHLAVALKNTGRYDDVFVEYSIPLAYIEKNIGGKINLKESDIRIDIVVSKDGRFCPIELKYKTKRIEDVQINRFGHLMSGEFLVKDQGAQDLGRYGLWKDVYRIELLRNSFSDSIDGGFAIFLTNDNSYTLPPKSQTVNYFEFSMEEGWHGKSKSWHKPQGKIAKDHPDFILDKEYRITWNETIYCKTKFFYCITQI